MNGTSAPAPVGVDEAAVAGLEMVPSRLVTPPRVKASPIHLECRYLQTVDLPSDTPGVRNAVVFGQVIGIHIDESVLTAGLVDMAKLKPIARLGYMDYCLVEEVFAMPRTAWPVPGPARSEEHTSEHQSLMSLSYAGFCLKTKQKYKTIETLSP